MSKFSSAVDHAPETAGAILATRVPVADGAVTAVATQRMLQSSAASLTTLNYVYVTKEEKLVGVVSIRELLAAAPETSLMELAITNLVTVSPDTDQEEVARLAVTHSLKAIPVVDNAQTLLGVVSTDTILQIIKHETTEDFLRMAGTTADADAATQLIDAGVVTHIRQRLPWLLLGVLGGTAAAIVVSTFEALLAVHVAVVAFIPLVVYLADAVGAQIQLIFIRSLTLRPHLSIRRYAGREVVVSSVLGAILAAVVGVVVLVWLVDVWVSVVLASAVFATVLAAMVLGLLLPWTFIQTHRDPAIASGPFTTVLIDLCSLLIYFSIATWLL